MKTQGPGSVFIVHAVDTEGPLHESLEATFKRIRDDFGVALSPTRKTLQAIRSGDLDLGEKHAAIADFISAGQIGTYNATWDQLETMHETVMDPSWRARFPDSAGQPYVVSWHCLDHVGFVDNPRRRAIGFHQVFDYYRSLLERCSVSRDRLYWHFHPVGFSRQANRFGRNWSYANTHNEILARRIIDRRWFPAAYRPGGHMEHYDANTWLEAWIPFDLANQNMAHNPGMEKLLHAGRIPGSFGDWRTAPVTWEVYHPSLYNPAQAGSLKRWIGRCLNMHARHSNVTPDEVRAAFSRAGNGEHTLVSVCNHDHRDMTGEIETFASMVLSVAKEFPDVSFRWSNAVEAFRKVLGLHSTEPAAFDFTLDEKKLVVRTSRHIWGVQPFLALRTVEGNYYHDNFIVDGPTQWTYPFDMTTIARRALSHIGVGCNDCAGNVAVTVCDLEGSGKWETTTHNTADWLE